MSLSNYKVGAGVAVLDMDRAREFYEGKLGLRPATDNEPADNVAYACAEGTRIHIYASPTGSSTPR